MRARYTNDEFGVGTERRNKMLALDGASMATVR